MKILISILFLVSLPVMAEPKYCLYSQQHVDLDNITLKYHQPHPDKLVKIYKSTTGKLLECTSVHLNPDKYNWSDKEMKGQVTEFVRDK